MKRARGMSVRESVFDEGSAEQHNKSGDKVLPQSGWRITPVMNVSDSIKCYRKLER